MTCKHCRIRPIAHNGYCDQCDPVPMVCEKIHVESMSPGVAAHRQTERRLPDGRVATVITVFSNFGEPSP